MLKPESAQSVKSDVKRSPAKHESYVIGKTVSTQLGHRPWAIVRLLPKAQRYVVARFFNAKTRTTKRDFYGGSYQVLCSRLSSSHLKRNNSHTTSPVKVYL